MGNLNIAVIGLGKMGLLHAGVQSALAGSPIEAASEKEGYLVKMVRKLVPNLKIYEDYLEMISKEESLDGVVITTPIQTHSTIILNALKARPDLAIFTEKPLAMSLQDARKVCEALRGRSGVHMVGFQKRYSATFRRGKDLLQSGVIGEPMFFRSYSFMSDIFRKGEGWRFKKGSGGVTLEHGPHMLDLILWYFGEPSSLSGIRKALYSVEVEDYVHASLSFVSGLTGYCDISWSIRNYRLPEMYIEIHGSNGVLKASEEYLSVQLDEDRGGISAGNHVFQRPELQPSVEFLLGDPEFTLQDANFRKAIQSRSLPETNFFEALKVNSIIDKIHSLPIVGVN